MGRSLTHLWHDKANLFHLHQSGPSRISQTENVIEKDTSTQTTGQKDTKDAVESSAPVAAPTPSHAYNGVSDVEALTNAWTTQSLIAAYLFAFLVFFINSLQQETTNSLSPYVYSAFEGHSLLSTTSVLTSIIGGVSKLPIAKIIDVWGRPEGFAVMVALCTLGLIMMAACHNVETYVAAQVLYWVGYNGMDYVLHVFLSDTTGLLNRAFIWGIASTPYIATTFAGPAAAQRFYDENAVRWGFGTFVILTPVVAAPILILLWYNRRKARKMGLVQKRERSGRTYFRSAKYYLTEFDAVGLILITAAFTLVLLPLTLASSKAHKWQSPAIIVMIIVGGFCFVAFALWERFCAPVSFLPFAILADRTLLGACILSLVLYVSFYSWDIYFSSYLQVVFNTTIKDTGYIMNIYSIGSCFWSVPLGLIIRKVGRIKWVALAAMPLLFLGSGLMIRFRYPNSPIGYVIMCEIFKAFAGGTLVICEEMAAMASGSHDTIAVAYAMVGLSAKIGGSIGSSICGAIWTNTVPQKLREYLPANSKQLAPEIYLSLKVALKYPIGNPIRDATIKAYGVAQRRMLITGVSILPLALFAVLMWKDIQLKQVKQIKGKVLS
ncbi:hypothetical protein DTO027B5_6427 [Paecilomyces variotii]|nr:hypothetical protein DTO021C3_6735 [Paecilomyces variotii]KAJ9322040.1 hypothetical protein DTO027B3_6892 [Paecilomyces variotii]KAJ9331751.1 hypothetical protein DTO027B5_6427 [Paecilomyces variotii]